MIKSKHREREAVVQELVERWAPTLKLLDWEQKLAALNEIHDYLIEEFQDYDEFCDVFPRFVAGLVDRMNAGPVTSVAQAHILANSANEEHRQRAGGWLRRQQEQRA